MKVSTDVSKYVELSSKILFNPLKINGGEYRNRTGVHGFAIRCVTIPPTRLCVLV